MKKILISVVFLTCLLACNKTENTETGLGIDDTLPAFTATMNNGTVITNLDYAEEVGIVAFFNTSCVDCKKELPVLQQVWDKYLTNIVFCPISREQGAASIDQYWTENSLTMPYSPQNDRTLYEKFASSGIPRIYVVANGKIVKMWSDEALPSFETLDACIEELSITISFDD